MAIVERAFAFAGHHHRRLQQLGELAQLVGGVAEHRAAAGDDQRTFGLGQQLRGFADLVAVGRRPADSPAGRST